MLGLSAKVLAAFSPPFFKQCTVALAGCGFLWLVRAGLHLPGLQPNPLKPCSPSSVSYL